MFDFQTAEYSVIGCILIDDRCFPAVRQRIPSADMFSSEACRKAYRAACALADRGKPVDNVTVGHESSLENSFLLECMALAPSCQGVESYADTVLEGYRRRQLQTLGETLHEGALTNRGSIEDMLRQAKNALESLSLPAGAEKLRSSGDSLRDFLAFRGEIQEGARTTVQSGFPGLDGILGGFAQGGLYILAARPGVGKSALGIAMADMLAKERSTLYVSLEMTAQELNARRIAAFSKGLCSFQKLLFGKTTAKEDADILETCDRLNRRNLFLSDESSITVPELHALAKRAEAEVVVVDYLGLITPRGRLASEYERVTQISGDLKRMAKGLGCVVIALCQLNRESAAVPNQRPRLSQLRSSGAIEQDADGVLLLHRPEDTGEAADPAAPQRFFVEVAKNRHGRTGTAELAWYAPINRFEDRSGKWTVKSWM